ncbi:MAG: DUF4160 domain-containing protein [Cytophagales bacterium]|nr:DUF4160 domain-containing protein [Cytophagales bacterium]
MPTLKIVRGIKIDCYYGDHPPPHVHAIYGEFEALIEIDYLSIYGGYLPCRQEKIAISFVKENQEKLLTIFNKMNPRKYRK